MKEKKDCKIVQDLLPNYIEKLTSEESNAYIENHLSSCEECQKVIKEMGGKLDIETEKYDNRKVNFFKKYKRKLRILFTILLFIILVFVFIIGRRIIIITSIMEKRAKLSNNYYTEFKTVRSDGTSQILKAYINGEDHLATITDYLGDVVQEVKIYYKKSGETAFFVDRGEKKVVTYGLDNFSMNFGVMQSGFENLEMAFHLSFSTSVKSTELNGRKCYLINSGLGNSYVDSETGLTVKSIYEDGRGTSTTEQKYQFDIVKDEDIVMPDTSGYEKTQLSK